MLITDIINYLVIVVIISTLVINKRLPLDIGMSLASTALLPFFLVGVLFPLGTFSDIIQFTIYTQFFRAEYGIGPYPYGWEQVTDFFGETVVHASSRLYSLLPLPFIDTFKSLGFYNILIYVFFITYIYSKKILSKKIILFLIFCPSVALHYSLGLRETIVICSTLLTFLFLIEEKYILFLFYFFVLFIFKFTNAFLLIIPIAMYFIFFYETRGYKRYIKIIIILVSSILFLVYLFNNASLIIDFLNGYRNNRYREDGVFDITFANNFFTMFYMMILGIPKFFLNPSIFNFENSFQAFVAIELLFLNIFIIYIFVWSFKISKVRALYWIVSLILCGMVFSYVVENTGSIYRYRLPIYLLYIFGTVYNINYYTKNKIKN